MREFTRAEIEHMRDLRRGGKSFRAISRIVHCGRDAAKRFTDGDVAQKAPPDAENTPEGRSIMHLVDLKRANHSPRRTEYCIQPDSPTPRRYQPKADVSCSIMGSSAALCEAEPGLGYTR